MRQNGDKKMSAKKAINSLETNYTIFTNEVEDMQKGTFKR